jgi:Bacterial Ig-like domain
MLLMLAALVASAVAVVLASPAQAAPFSVTNTADSGEGSLRQAISDANASAGEDTIAFGPPLSDGTITLASQLPVITDSAGVSISGASAKIKISGNNNVRVFEVGSGAKLALHKLTVANGRSSPSCSFCDYFGSGGGIYNAGTLTVTNSTLSNNEASHTSSSSGGGIYNTDSGTLTVGNSTLFRNRVSCGGGGIYNQGSLTVTNSTLSHNNATLCGGGGISNDGLNSTATLKNTIIANSELGGNCAGTITNGGYNLDSGTSCGFATENNSLSSTDPMLGAELADNGGPTLTHALLAGSPAIDKGSSFSATIDQRGLPRPSNFVGIVNAADGSDIGAFERQAPPDTTAPKVTNTTVPAAGAMQVGPGVNVTATFTEAMDASPTATDGDPSTINGTTVKLFRAGTTTAIGAVVSYNATTNKATLNPNSNLQLGTKYKAVVTTGAQDLSGNRLDQNSILEGLQQKTWTFTIRN